MRLKLFMRFPVLVLFALLAACDTDPVIFTHTPNGGVSYSGTPSPTVPVIPPAVINISRKDYEEALAKWESHRIEEFEIEYGEIPHASSEEGRSNYYIRGSAWGNLPDDWPSGGAIATPVSVSIRDYPEPVHALFAEIERALEFVESNVQAPMVYRVEFDPILGYPSLFEEYCREEYGNCGTDSHTRKRIIRLEVLKRR